MIEVVHHVRIVKNDKYVFSAWNIWLKSLKYRQQNVIWSSGKQSLLFLLFHLFRITKFPTLFNWFVDRKINFVEIQKIFFFSNRDRTTLETCQNLVWCFWKTNWQKRNQLFKKYFLSLNKSISWDEQKQILRRMMENNPFSTLFVFCRDQS
jgi:hypothetical protein